MWERVYYVTSNISVLIKVMDLLKVYAKLLHHANILTISLLLFSLWYSMLLYKEYICKEWVVPSSVYGFWLTVWYLQALLRKLHMYLLKLSAVYLPEDLLTYLTIFQCALLKPSLIYSILYLLTKSLLTNHQVLFKFILRVCGVASSQGENLFTFLQPTPFSK
jgi:hypothetical protein